MQWCWWKGCYGDNRTLRHNVGKLSLTAGRNKSIRHIHIQSVVR